MSELRFHIYAEPDTVPLSISILKSDDHFVLDYQDVVDGILQHNFFKDDPNNSMRNTFGLLASVIQSGFEKRGFDTDNCEMEAKIVAIIRKKAA
jgi:hypothetical protein